MPKVFVIMPFSRDFEDVEAAISEAAVQASSKTAIKFELSRGAEGFSAKLIIHTIYDNLSQSDIIIADITGGHPSAMYELGYVHALRKPTILIRQKDESSPFNVMHSRIIVYDRNQLSRQLSPILAEALVEANANPKAFTDQYDPNTDAQIRKPTAFVSYSHADKECLHRLQVHLRPLERENLVDIWADTRIKVGERWKDQIQTALDDAAVAILLISADFLASDFIVDNELPPLLAAAEQRGTLILPVILKPCRFEREDHLSQFQAINSPSEPLLKLNDIEQEEIYAKVAEIVELEIRSRSAL